MVEYLIRRWNAMYNSYRSGSFSPTIFLSLFEESWGYLLASRQMLGECYSSLECRALPLYNCIYAFSKCREIPGNAPRREFEAATTYCESLIDSISRDLLGVNEQGKNCFFRNGWLKLGISWDVDKLVNIDNLAEDFVWLCHYYEVHYGY